MPYYQEYHNRGPCFNTLSDHYRTSYTARNPPSCASSWKIKCSAIFPTDLIPLPYPHLLLSATGQNDDGNALEKMEPGTISYLQPGEDVKGVGMERPGREFTPFVNRVSAFVGRPLALFSVSFG